jgi:hypothetical protein
MPSCPTLTPSFVRRPFEFRHEKQKTEQERAAGNYDPDLLVERQLGQAPTLLAHWDMPRWSVSQATGSVNFFVRGRRTLRSLR